MQKGFGWAKQDYWRIEKVKEIPDMDEIEKRIQFIESLGVARDKIDDIVNKFPEILAMDIDGVMKPAVEHIEKNFFHEARDDGVCKVCHSRSASARQYDRLRRNLRW